MRAALLALMLGATFAAADVPRPKPQPAPPPEPNALVLVLDRSGSMQGPKMEAAKQAAIAAASTLRPDDQFGVVVFDSEALVFVQIRPSKDRVKIAKEIERLQSGGGTNILPGLQEASKILAPLKAKVKHVILLSDGEAPTDGIADLVKEMRKNKITISTVGVQGADENLLKEISKEGGGRYYKVEDLKRLSQTYVDETKLSFK